MGQATALPDVVRQIERVDPAIVKEAARYPSSILADVAGRRGALSGRIAALDPAMRFAGPALTVEVRPGDNLMIHAAFALAKPGDVIVVDGKGDLSSALMGEIMCQQCIALGVAGVVIDGAGRSVKRGDGVSFDSGEAGDDEQGGRVYDAAIRRDTLELAFGHGAIDWDQIRPGMRVWKNDDPELNSRLRKSFTAADPQRRTAVDLVIHATIGQPLYIAVATETGLQFEFAGQQPCAEAQKHPLSAESLREQFGSEVIAASRSPVAAGA